MTRTMNEMDGDTRHDYDKYIMEVMQMEWEQQQVLRMSAEQGSAKASQVAADDMMSNDVLDVNEHDEWVEEVYAAEELERAMREAQEARDDL